jgi:hypothetical protein
MRKKKVALFDRGDFVPRRGGKHRRPYTDGEDFQRSIGAKDPVKNDKLFLFSFLNACLSQKAKVNLSSPATFFCPAVVGHSSGRLSAI